MAKKIVLLRRFYVYGIKVDGIVRYVGKGCNGRIYSHAVMARSGKHKGEKLYTELRAALQAGRRTDYILYRDDLTERDALALEAETIRAFWKRKPGQLWNNPHDERWFKVRSRISKNYWADPAARKKHGEMIKAKWQDGNYRERARANMRIAAKQRWQEPGYREKVSGAVSEAISAKWQDDPEYRARWKRGRWGD